MASTVIPSATSTDEERARDLKENALVIDILAGRLINPEPPAVDGKPHLERVIDAGCNIVSMTLAARNDTFDAILDMMYGYFNLMSARPEQTLHVKTVDDIHLAHREGKLGIIFGTQTATVVDKVIGRWTILHELGLRVAQLTYNEATIFGNGCMEPHDGGLTAFGRLAVQEMNRLGILVDCSHGGERTTLDILDYSMKPVVFSHANPKKLSPSRRNVTDEQMKKVAETGGAIGITPHSMLTYREYGKRPTLEDFLDMVEYSVGLIGIDHVGIGTDLMEQFTKLTWESTTKRMYPNPFFFETMWAEGFHSVSYFPNMIAGLVRRGFKDDDVRKILGLNWVRIFSEVWAPNAGLDPEAVRKRDSRLWN